ncbi:Reverse transcriptase, RNA-dependent DNA polymerase [Lasallia pustulata]|uniref:Reverse transcriptase, RNA-dependent DNA polymerase n=1 Tax=Lasallia pustulata TaxID=136370 RepID=A0A1W5DEM3_9LECA|nr:Reverse transcriptase, RNA-dependent DNA polymerase [Lasallia pustulata]
MENEDFLFKARWVVKGYTQREGIDYTKTYASVVNKATTKIILAVAAARGYYIKQMDIVTAFLYGPLEEEVYMEQPTGFGAKGKEDLTISTTLKGLGFQLSKYDHGLFLNPKKPAYITIYVDDIHLIGPDKEYIDSVKANIASHYKIKDLGPTVSYLGLEISRNRANRTLTISQKTYVESVLEAHGMADCKPALTPMETGIVLQKSDEEYTPSQDFTTRYQSMLSSIIYIMLQTRPDIAYTVSKLSQYSSKPNEKHLQALKQVLRYLSGMKDLGWGCDIDNGKSTSGYIFQLYGGSVSWSSQKQVTVTKSTCEAKYMGQSDAASEAVWICGLLEDLGLFPNRPTTLNADNHGAIRLASNPKNHR